jgi:hypothetical protein
MPRYQVTGTFFVDEEFMQVVPTHRAYIDDLITRKVIEHYIVSMDKQEIWITLTALSRAEADKLISSMPLAKYTTWEIAEVFIYDGINYRLPVYVLN